MHVLTVDLEGKRLELLGELVPASAPIAVLINPTGEQPENQVKDVQAGALRIGRQILILNASSERDIDSAFMTVIERRAAGLLVTGDPFFNNRREQLPDERMCGGKVSRRCLSAQCRRARGHATRTDRKIKRLSEDACRQHRRCHHKNGTSARPRWQLCGKATSLSQPHGRGP
jgi:hypothetical protein